MRISDFGEYSEEINPKSAFRNPKLRPSIHFPRTQAASICHSLSFFDAHHLPPGWNDTPPASAASGINNKRLALGSPGVTRRLTASKLRRDSSSLHVVLPGDSGCRRKPVPCE